MGSPVFINCSCGKRFLFIKGSFDVCPVCGREYRTCICAHLCSECPFYTEDMTCLKDGEEHHPLEEHKI
jgi:rRNA maturation protein Nop10